MKTKILLFAIMLTSMFSKAQNKNDEIRFNELKVISNYSDIIFEGTTLKKLESHYDEKKQIYTEYEVKVSKSLKNTSANISIIIEMEGGVIGNEFSEGSSHGYSPTIGVKSLYFLKKNERGNYTINFLCNISNPDLINGNVSFNTTPYTKLEALYIDLSKICGQEFKVEKKSIVVKENTVNNSLNNVSYSELVNNYNTLISKKTEQYFLNQSSNNLNKPLAQDVTLQVSGGLITGTTTKFLEFDVNIKSTNSLSFLDNMPVWITYNSAVFGTNVVANGKVTLTNGTSFNNTQYLQANANKSDQATNSFAFAVGTDYLLSNPTRVNITTTYKLLAHVKIEMTNCGNATAVLSDASTAINAAFYTTSSTASSSSFQNYTSLLYNGSIANSLPCPPTIIDFNSPINGGVSETFTIKGVGFGSSRGNGQVKFRQADLFGFPYINKIDNQDYLIWNDTTIQIKFPSVIDTNQTGLNFVTPGSGNFKVIINNATDSTISNVNLFSQPFKVYYSIYNDRAPSVNVMKKAKYNVAKVKPTGGYVIRLDTSISNHADRKGCVIKAVKDWRCLTGINIKIGSDTIMQKVKTDSICNIYFDNTMIGSPFAALTKTNRIICSPSNPSSIITDFDTRIKPTVNWFYDTTGLAIPIGKADFYEAITHEIGHGIGMAHVVDSSAVMFYKLLGDFSNTISAANRRRLQPSTSDADGGLDQVLTSQTNITGQCGFVDMVQVVGGSCTGTQIGVEELINSNFNIIVYPNPSTDGDINISFDAVENVKPKIELYNLLGEKVIEESVINNGGKHFITKLNLNELSNGIYILNVIVNKNKASYKIVKQ